MGVNDPRVAAISPNFRRRPFIITKPNKLGGIEMTNSIVETSPLVYARVAGLAYIVIIMLGIFSVSFIETNLVVPGNDAATVNNILTNELRFRISVASEIVMFVLVVLLSLSLYVILKTVNKNLALLALLWRLGEAIIGGSVTVLGGLIPLLLLHREAAFETEQLQALVGRSRYAAEKKIKNSV